MIPPFDTLDYTLFFFPVFRLTMTGGKTTAGGVEDDGPVTRSKLRAFMQQLTSTINAHCDTSVAKLDDKATRFSTPTLDASLLKPSGHVLPNSLFIMVGKLHLIAILRGVACVITERSKLLLVIYLIVP